MSKTSPKAMHYKQNRLKQLRAFCQVARTLSVSKAAEKLFLSQPSVSLQIQALERELGATLFERRGPRMRLTPEGAVLLELVTPLVQNMDALPETFAAHCGRLDKGELHIAAGESTILYLLPEFIRRFVTDYPGISLKLHNETGRDGLAMLRADEVDLAVGSMIEIPDDIIYRPSFTYDPLLIMAPDHPLAKREDVTLADISPYGLILPPRHLSTWRIVDYVFQQHGLPYRVALEAGGWEVIKRYVAMGLGISIVTSICITPQDKEKLVTLPLTRYFPKRSYGLVVRRGKFLSPPAKRFIDMMDPEFFRHH